MSLFSNFKKIFSISSLKNEQFFLKSKFIKLSNKTDLFFQKNNNDKIKSILLFISKSSKLAINYGVIPTTRYFTLPIIKKFIVPTLKYTSKTKIGKSFILFGGTAFCTRVYYVYGTGFKTEIIVSKTMNQIGEKELDGKNEYLVCDHDGNIYKIRNCLMRLSFRSSELFM